MMDDGLGCKGTKQNSVSGESDEEGEARQVRASQSVLTEKFFPLTTGLDPGCVCVCVCEL